MKHPTYVINLKNRTERLRYITAEFMRFQEFDLKIFTALEDKNGAIGLYKSFKAVIKEVQTIGVEYVIICEDDHKFTADFDIDLLNKYIEIGAQSGMDILLGGASSIHDLIFVNDDLLWVDGFTGLQFTVVFKSFFSKILDLSLPEGGVLDIELGKISDDIFCIYPSISEQEYFGYSDVTKKNNLIDVTEYFKKCRKKMDYFYLLTNYYNNLRD
ncbi:glycosyl transferase [Sphingobacterium sp. HMA12]|uniref:glycosyl transferase n=1 Tax=Sphingobacterium sp. HMA12 TaxID=2050894 RepID=UPI000CEA337F|nr:glycosyl transferase [Sphingobacterium sp. HMA12]